VLVMETRGELGDSLQVFMVATACEDEWQVSVDRAWFSPAYFPIDAHHEFLHGGIADSSAISCASHSHSGWPIPFRLAY
jgi:hypothetical protein